MIEELDYQRTPLGELVLRRRRSPSVPQEFVYEVKLDDEMLMSSSVNESERALARLALERVEARPCDVLIGGLGLGYTAAAALDAPRVRRVDVIELLAPVIGWHQAGLVPASAQLRDDPRCSFIEGDFFEYVRRRSGEQLLPRYDAILLDIDHSPDCWLHPRHAEFYTEARLRDLLSRLCDGGVFALWSAAEPSQEFLALLLRVFATATAHEVRFHNPHVREEDINWVIVAGGRGG